MNETDLQYKRAVLLAASLTSSFNKYNYSYSEACWDAHEIFRKKNMYPYAIYPDVSIIDNKIIVTAVRWVE